MAGGAMFDISNYLKAATMGIVEGLTEFLPISSTGHLILTGSLLKFTGNDVKVFEIAIQTGAMVAVIWFYRIRIMQLISGMFTDRVSSRFIRNVIIAFIPAVILGLAVGKFIQDYLFNPISVSLAAS